MLVPTSSNLLLSNKHVAIKYRYCIFGDATAGWESGTMYSLLLLILNLASTPATASARKIVIVGAGISGQRAARAVAWSAGDDGRDNDMMDNAFAALDNYFRLRFSCTSSDRFISLLYLLFHSHDSDDICPAVV